MIPLHYMYHPGWLSCPRNSLPTWSKSFKKILIREIWEKKIFCQFLVDLYGNHLNVIFLKVLTKKEGSKVFCDADKIIYNLPDVKKRLPFCQHHNKSLALLLIENNAMWCDDFKSMEIFLQSSRSKTFQNFGSILLMKLSLRKFRSVPI